MSNIIFGSGQYGSIYLHRAIQRGGGGGQMKTPSPPDRHLIELPRPRIQFSPKPVSGIKGIATNQMIVATPDESLGLTLALGKY